MKQEETRGTGSPHFHYDRSDRLASDECETKPPESFIKRNRTWLITLADIVLLLIMFVLYRLFLTPHPERERLEGVEFRLESFLFEDELYVTVEVERLDTDTEIGDPVIRVAFPDGSTVEDVVPEQSGQIHTIRQVVSAESIAGDDSGDDLQVTVSIHALGQDFVLRQSPD